MVNGWTKKFVQDYASLVTKGTTPTSIGLNFTDSGILFVKIESIVNNKIDKNMCAFISSDTNLALSRSVLKENDILVSIAGALGRCAKVGNDILPANTNQALAIIRLDDETICIDYVFKYLQSEMIYKQISEISVQGAQANLSLENIKFLVIYLPTDITEQRRIAAVLSDTDALIAAMEKLIAKKCAIKKGTMQELLTGKRRLSGFSDEWVEKKISDFGVVVTGATPSTSVAEYWNGNIPWVTPTDISVAKDIFTTERMITECGLSAIRELPTNTLLITCIASIGKNTILKSIGASNQQINAIIPKANYNVDFLYYLFEINKSYLLGKAGQTATNIISKQDFSEFIFTVPCSLPEQIAIASILSDMDAEIDMLTAKLNKLRNIKQGMMSELLTGHIRLPENEDIKNGEN